jgi:hypothetical protein
MGSFTRRLVQQTCRVLMADSDNHLNENVRPEQVIA